MKYGRSVVVIGPTTVLYTVVIRTTKFFLQNVRAYKILNNIYTRVTWYVVVVVEVVTDYRVERDGVPVNNYVSIYIYI